MATIRLLVVAESPVMRAGLRALLGAEPGFVVAGVAPTLDDVAGDADVVVWVAPPGTIAAPVRDDDARGEAAAPEPALVVLADHVDAALVRHALAAGARAVLPLDAGEATVVAAVHAAAAGLVTLPGELASALVGSGAEVARGAAPDALPSPSPPGGNGSALTPREREVLALLAQGLANKQIAPRLGITEHTVKAHVAAIYEKVGAGNRAEATVAAARLGLLLL